ncbi:MAG: ATPase [Prevotella sp.]|nr:ATPase [Prevotella sp.]
MKIIADSGSTKTEWLVADGNKPVERFVTSGLNPLVLGIDSFRESLRNELLPRLWGYAITQVEFYGAGCTPEMEAEVSKVFTDLLGATDIIVKSDLIGACRALCKGQEGIVAILGTGSNSCLFDGEKIVSQTPSLGYILGDEGSGAALGRLFLNALYKGRLPAHIGEAFRNATGLAQSDIILRVYRQPRANTFLASFAPFLKQWCGERAVRDLIVSNFRDFFRVNIRPYRRPDLPVGCVGSIALHFSPMLREAAQREGYAVGDIVSSPLYSLLEP